jgi:hypothetical protein
MINGRRGGPPIKVPFAIRTSDPVLSAFFGEVRRAIQGLRDSIPQMQNRPRASGGASLQFRVSVRLDGETYKAKVQPGWVRSISPDADAIEPVKDWMPTMGSGPAVPLDDATAPEITVVNGQTVYCRIATTAKGIIEEAPKIEAETTPEAGVHFQPPNAAIEGDLYFPLANITITGSPAVVTIEQIQQGGPIVVVPNLPEIKNIGAKREVFSARIPAGDSYDFRTLEQLEGDGEPIIKELDPGDPEADPPVAAEEEGDTIPFRRIAPKATSPQITITDGGDVIRVEGNGYDQSFGGLVTGLTVADGLVTAFSDAGGADLNLTVETLEWLNNGGVMEFVSYPGNTVHYWRNGLYIGTTDPEDSPEGLIEQTVTKMFETS